MRYRWNENTLISIRNKLIKLINNTDDYEKINLYRKSLDALNNVYFLGFSNFKPDNTTSIKEYLYDITNSFTGYGRYYSLLGEILKNLLPLDKEIQNIEKEIISLEDNTNFRVLTSRMLTHDKTYSKVNDFYEYLDNELYNHFLKHYNNRYKYTRFTTPNYNRLSNLFSYNGDCIFINGVNVNLITVINDYAIQKYMDLTHECGHAISNFMNPQASLYEATMITSEVESLFPETLSLLEEKEYFTQLEKNYMLFARLSSILEDAKLFAQHKLIVDLWQDFNFQEPDEFFQELEHYNISKNLLKQIGSLFITGDGTYIFSYAIVLNLLDIYKQDKKSALDLYKYIINNQNKIDSLELIKSTIDITSSIKEESQIIINNLKKSLKEAKK